MPTQSVEHSQVGPLQQWLDNAAEIAAAAIDYRYQSTSGQVWWQTSGSDVGDITG